MISTPVKIERTLNAPVSVVWKALTDPGQMKEWYFNLPGFKAEVGYEFSFTGGPDEGRQYIHLCKVTEVIKEKKISYTWRYEGYPGNSTVSFVLQGEGSVTHLEIIHEGLDTFSKDNSDFASNNFVEGWTWFGDSIKKFVEAE
jgi:uncharacterized protein YndB with AHSA1/START domain